MTFDCDWGDDVRVAEPLPRPVETLHGAVESKGELNMSSSGSAVIVPSLSQAKSAATSVTVSWAPAVLYVLVSMLQAVGTCVRDSCQETLNCMRWRIRSSPRSERCLVLLERMSRANFILIK
jgi:hypothetical protein